MKQIKVSEASGVVLDWLVAKCEGYSVFKSGAGPSAKIVYIPARKRTHYVYRPSTNWVQGGPIIEREDINTNRYTRSEVTESGQEIYRKDGWTAYTTATAYWITPTRTYGPTPLIAATRCYVASKLGEIVEVPDELA